MSGTAASLVDQAKKWAGHYGAFPNGAEGAALSAPLRLRAAWDDNDADAFADVFIENGSLLVGDEQLDGREAIRTFMAEQFQGVYKGARLVEEPVDVRFVTPEVATVITQSAVVLAGESEPPPQREARAMWVLVLRDGVWMVASQQTSPIRN
ncbi:SgcJ/EcaC family oxidoreductase [Solwaraspora sp. WMMD406]|uniref:SgcJ/EcaC family oxidoreductase n=1 Tax=Solwaraspora sp. WMMD406 TaxID=3016095 RepID=UPI002417189F|nr:SgcJ/EcaC family oxidoreductase [Solwaraspora sp. WMMD406]MDG4766929.1 SgcJ/EcaC family oxidoreductase [Solwaraspora sp. WMMD406]